MPVVANSPFGTTANPLGPAIQLNAITKSDTDELPQVVRWIYVGGTGNVAVKDTVGNTVTFTAVPVGSTLGPFYVKQVLSTGTTATLLVGFV
jgi:hypothetical protein